MSPKDFLGRGWRFPVTADGRRGRIVLSEYEQDIRESLRIILGTRRGERLMRPDFGCGIHDLPFESINTTLQSLVQTSVRDALLAFEPRIEVTDIRVSTEDADRGRLTVFIDYVVRQSNRRDNLVFPFNLREGTAA